MQNEQDKMALHGMLIHCCDFFGNVKAFDISKEWSIKVNKEFSQQVFITYLKFFYYYFFIIIFLFSYFLKYTDEGKLGLPQTSYYKDLDHKEVLIRNEINFTKVIIQPLWKVFNQFLDNECEICINNSINNLISWEKHLEEAERANKINIFETIKEEGVKTEGEEGNFESSCSSEDDEDSNI